MHKSQAPCSIPCDLCDSKSVDELSLKDRDGSYLRTVICQHCGLVYSDPRPTAEEVRDYYRHSYRVDYKATYQPKAKHIYRSGKVALDRWSRLQQFLPPQVRILDVGAGGGEFLYLLKSIGLDVSGFEPNEGYAEFAAQVLGLPVQHGFYQDAKITAGSLDVVTMFHVAEHLESPRDVIRLIKQWLKPNGVLVVEVPNVEATCQAPHNRFHRAHLYNFNPATLEMVGRQVGFSVVETQVSSDGGNVTVVFKSNGNGIAPSVQLPGNYEKVSRIVRDHTPISHLLSVHPYVRPLRKIATRFEEWRNVRSSQTPRQILDDLISNEMRGKQTATAATKKI